MATRTRTRAVPHRSAAPAASEPPAPRAPRRGRSKAAATTQPATRDEVDAHSQGDEGLADSITVAVNHQLPPGIERPANSPGGLSGTTARTSLNSAPGVDSDPDDMVDNLMKLNDAASSLIDRLAPKHADPEAIASVRKSFVGGTGVTGRLLPAIRRSFAEAWQTYGGAGTLIKPDATLRKLLQLQGSDNLPNVRWRPDDVFFKANLARACEDVFGTFGESEIPDLNWDKLNREFPEPYMRQVDSKAKELACGTSRLARQTFNVALRLRTQFAIRMLQTSSDRSAEDFLDEVFGSDEALEGWEVDGLRSEDLSEDEKSAIISNKQMLLRGSESQAQDDSATSTFIAETLNKLFPVSGFLRSYITWIRQRSEEIDSFLESVGKVPGIQEEIEQSLKEQRATDDSRIRHIYSASRTPAPKERYSLLSDFPSQQNDHKLLSSSAKAAIWRQHKQRPSLPADPGKAAVTQHAPQQSPRRQELKNDQLAHRSARSAGATADVEPPVSDPVGPAADADKSIPGQDERRAIIRFHRSREAEANKENSAPAQAPTPTPNTAPSTSRQRPQRFIDAQDDRQRIDFDTQAIAVESSKTDHARESSTEPSQDVGFEQDTRPMPNPRKRSAPQDERPPDKRYRIAAAQEDPEAARPIRQSREPSRQPSLSTLQDPSSAQNWQPTTVAPAWIGTNKKKIMWDDDETNYLLEAIEKYGLKWSEIKNNDNESKLKRRNQIALKDKARNLKIDYLRGNRRMPLNLGQMHIKSTDIEKLLNEGVSPSALGLGGHMAPRI